MDGREEQESAPAQEVWSEEQREDAERVKERRIRRINNRIEAAQRGIAACEQEIADHKAQMVKLEEERAEVEQAPTF